MLEDLQKYEKLGSKEELLILLFKILSIHDYKDIDEVKTICLHHSYTFGSSFNGMIKILNLLDLIKIQDNGIKADSIILNYEALNFFNSTLIYERLFILLHKSDRLIDFFNHTSTKLDNESLSYYVRDSHIPLSLNNIKKLLINTDFFVKNDGFENVYYINPLFKNFFKTIVIPEIKRKSQEKKLSKDELNRLQDLQNEYGVIAEEYVLKFELNRLTKHPEKQEIKKISEEFVNAGFDIESYNTEDSIFIDRFIEVKSFVGNPYFYWSKNEIETAKDLGSQYFLYLVNRDEITNQDYAPIIIKNPYQNVLQNDIWIKEVDKYRIELIK